MKVLHTLIFLFISFYSLASDTLVVGYTQAPPFILEGANVPSGVNVLLWSKIADDLKLTYKFEHRSFNDLIQGVANDEIDICINPLTLTAERSENMRFTSPFFVSNSTAVIAKSEFNQLRTFIITFFSTEFLAALLGLILIIALFGTLTWYFERKKNPKQFRPGAIGIWDGLWWSAVTMTTVGYGDKAPQSRGGKIIALIWMFTALMFISGLTASIASTIISSQEKNHPITLNELHHQKVGTVANTGTVDYLKNNLFRNIVHFNNVTDGLQALSTGEIDAFIYDEPILKYRLDEHPEFDFTILPLKFNLQLYGFAISKARSDLAHEISQRILYHTNSLEWPIILRDYNLEVI